MSPARRRCGAHIAMAALCVAAAACGAADAGEPQPTPAGTVGIGVLPEPLGPGPTAPVARAAPSDSTTTTGARRTTTTTTTTTPDVPPRTVGALAGGNRVIMLGDSILASTSRRYGDTMCDALVPLGWRVEIDAEVSRTISFGNQVLRDRMEAGWDAGLVLLGNNHDGDEHRYFAELARIVTAFGDRPVVLLTVTEFEPGQAEVNEVIRGVADAFPNVVLVDWAAISTLPGVVGGDGLHLTDRGRQVLADAVAPHFGPAPAVEGQPGECLPTRYRDDSAGSVDGPRGNGSRPPSTPRPPSTTRPVTATTRPPTSTTRPPTTQPVGTQPGVTQPPATQPSGTQPPATQPSPTQPSPTQPSPTQPPATQPSVSQPPATQPVGP